MPKVILIIDGNNLAYWAYRVQPGKLSNEHCVRLVRDLETYRQAHPNSFTGIEVCFDGQREWPEAVPGHFRVFDAQAGMPADEMIAAQFQYHHLLNRRVVVITNDGELADEIREQGGQALLVYDFVQVAREENPRFLSPRQFAFKWPQKEERASEAPGPLGHALLKRRAEKTPPAPVTKSPVKPKAPPDPAPLPEPIEPPVEEDGSEPEDEGDETAGAWYRLTLARWPAVEGVRFLVQSFCPAHRPAVESLVEQTGLDQVRPADIPSLANVLLETCAGESDFTRRGSLMDRVRLVLLKAGDEPVTLEQIAQEGGLKRIGLHGKIKRKASPWLEFWR